MKFCTFPFEYFYIDNYQGEVSLCPWMTKDVIFIGNLNHQSVEDIWDGPKANALRDKIRRGDFSSCRMDGCPFLQNRNLPDVKPEEAAEYAVASTPKTVNLAFDFICNQYCETCRQDKFRPIIPRYPDYMNAISSKIGGFLDHAEMISTSGHGDPFASPYMMEILRNINPQKDNLKLYFESNGVYCDERHWRKISHLLDFNVEINITVNSYNPFIYKHISRGGNYERLMRNLDFVKALRKSGKVEKLVLTMVIQDRNFRDIPEFIERSLNKYECDQVILRPVYQWGTMPEETFWFKDVLNPMHPYHKEYLEILDLPILEDSRVYNFGGRSVHEPKPYPRQ